jgi:hypothetical protein
MCTSKQETDLRIMIEMTVFYDMCCPLLMVTGEEALIKVHTGSVGSWGSSWGPGGRPERGPDNLTAMCEPTV